MPSLDAFRLYSLGITAAKFNWGHVREAFTESKLYVSALKSRKTSGVVVGLTLSVPDLSPRHYMYQRRRRYYLGLRCELLLGGFGDFAEISATG
jgi:hypothetical protein